MFTYTEIRPIADELLARAKKMAAQGYAVDPKYASDVYDLAREYLNNLLGQGVSPQLLRTMSPSEILDLYETLNT